ncbi:cytochrome P450 monooxygenase 60 [Heterobasidion irregulare TC 32-1]|uniref:Cytochrome P450 monooxygenase 60 n=1 Tax=Heterobasidion irregulare (strain TC 32-1) TaxID=747525 RepID=W4JW86_HETIT|nr:cytochrome P450 monooxygenase 60 [Heterobasidion irregulare TC 32-1]ETW77818.1 cytochrome P450 monooxygenase 60 [Heterobasidion irregulare TC 32-1]
MPDILAQSALMPSISPSSLAVFVIVFVAYRLVKHTRSPWRKLPPGPRGLPIIGNVFLPRNQQWLMFTEWKKSYGALVYLNMAGQPMVVINSHKVATDLLDHRAANYSDRPRFVVGSEIMSGGLHIFLARYTDVWRRMRKATHECMRKNIVHRYHPNQRREAIIMASDMLTSPQNWKSHIERNAASFIMSFVYDSDPILSEKDSRAHRMTEVINGLASASLPGAHLLSDRFAKWKRDAEQCFVRDSMMFEGLYNGVRKSLMKGDNRPSLCATLIEEQARHDLSERESAWAAASTYVAGADTTAASFSWWMLAMLAYPDAQKRAQAEIDSVVGRSRLPSFSDMDHLPYLRAMVKETFRWRSPDPLGVPHSSCKDDWYQGLFIPAGTICIVNCWALNHDPDIYGPDVDQFRPDRHLNNQALIVPGSSDTKEDGHVSYGFGRRICIGKHLANNSLLIDMAIMLWAMNIERATDENGIELPLDIDGSVDEGLMVRPVPFKCKTTPRFPEAISILEQERELIGF